MLHSLKPPSSGQPSPAGSRQNSRPGSPRGSNRATSSSEESSSESESEYSETSETSSSDEDEDEDQDYFPPSFCEALPEPKVPEKLPPPRLSRSLSRTMSISPASNFDENIISERLRNPDTPPELPTRRSSLITKFGSSSSATNLSGLSKIGGSGGGAFSDSVASTSAFSNATGESDNFQSQLLSWRSQKDGSSVTSHPSPPDSNPNVPPIKPFNQRRTSMNPTVSLQLQESTTPVFEERQLSLENQVPVPVEGPPSVRHRPSVDFHAPSSSPEAPAPAPQLTRYNSSSIADVNAHMEVSHRRALNRQNSLMQSSAAFQVFFSPYDSLYISVLLELIMC
jgi:hypothetical protein